MGAAAGDPHGGARDGPAAAGTAGGSNRGAVVPPVYRFRGFHRHAFQGRKALVAVYDGPGGETLSVFQAPAMGMEGMKTGPQGKRKVRVLTARKGQADVAVVAPLPEDELRKVMDSIPATP
jgi:hypothetical protein